uniref:[phosphatase 2A protein]-leucine-carboxy methyltransferase n=1 Tax=Chromera velia CCMP2878 TaxID=1169474 RepID=A0A0G4GPT2_9ALVE|eukprot:Cvel_22819.t1-p1 / transcript=Cvel_22819.t1 / gene=Cvel_22819 / organism=Chromera_velia_CCMP2878 / gene_product=Leucine carboxyl methyltransferase 1, putative / transcript_product=Leucine carboxyl methyltransferase 1, putative / location=Cvel_scaffold2285:12322-20302(+) / protein_length=419 / sequence_SO=supercontig / SO=protein_coding / is_pseudo=false
MSSGIHDSFPLPQQPGGGPLSGDLAVQGTTDDAALSKLSAINAGYYEDPFLKHFCSRAARRSPLINRGYYARVAGMRKVIDLFLDAVPPGMTPQLVNLGAGLDTTFFYVNSRCGDRPFVFFEVDFPELVARKSMTILRKEACWSVLAPNKDDIPQVGGLIRTDKLRMVGADLRDLQKLEGEVRGADFSPTQPTLFFCECVLVYMKGEQSDQVLRWASSLVHAPSSICIYEQCNPDDAFGRVMVENLQSRGCALLGLKDYPSIASQRRRLRTAGWAFCRICDMNDVYDKMIDQSDVMRIQRLELFDEIEEWRLIQSHYFIAVAVTSPQASQAECTTVNGSGPSAEGEGYADPISSQGHETAAAGRESSRADETEPPEDTAEFLRPLLGVWTPQPNSVNPRLLRYEIPPGIPGVEPKLLQE